MLEKTEFDASSVLLSSQLPPIPAKRYFTIGEVADLYGVRSHVLRYWEQEFSQLSPQATGQPPLLSASRGSFNQKNLLTAL
uniref:Putative transcriptional regulator, MerR family n=1 Tax=Polynucleobacter necessarius subsp. necessarius (strain STIR1) TaxID=452638 RepID=B1XV07_POLNS